MFRDPLLSGRVYFAPPDYHVLVDANRSLVLNCAVLGVVDLRDVVERVRSELLAVHPTRAVDVHTRGDCAGEWDAERMAQALSNLVSNALVHGAGGAPVTVTLEGARDEVAVSVHNAGVIEPSVRAEIFDPFRSARARGRGEGVGLGLFIVQEIVRAHGARIDVMSSEEEGTTFRFTLPRA